MDRMNNLAMVFQRATLVLIALLLVGGRDYSGVALAQTPGRVTTEVADKLMQKAIEVHDKQRNVGLALVIKNRESVLFTLNRGYSDLEHRVPVKEETRFGIASITKLFTAATLLRLHARGVIDFDAAVQTYVPEFPTKSETPITVRMLATHRSGIPHPTKRTPELFATHYESALKAMEIFIDDSLLAVPGSKRVYSSSNYNLLAAIIEKVTGRLFTDVVREEIFDPLGLTDTEFDTILRPAPGRSRRYSFYHPWTYEESQEIYVVPTWDYSFNAGGGNIISTANDVTSFGVALLSPGFLPKTEHEILWSDEWFGRSGDMGRVISATGSNPGVQAAMAIVREKGIVSVVLSNTWGIGARSAEMVKLAAVLSAMVP